ncbi:hypothetical protein HanRHA438_Chr16g0738221 [Helianthus annuus]|nr:hypothetical protein HanRHA438_Chr16g0738221 [Helianthus annuus]
MFVVGLRLHLQCLSNYLIPSHGNQWLGTDYVMVLVPEELFEDTRDDPKELGKFDKATTDSYIN